MTEQSSEECAGGSSESRKPITRRPYLQMVGASLATGLAGCFGGESDEDAAFSYWSVDWSQTDEAEELVTQSVEDFESESGETVNLRLAENPAEDQQTWIQAIENGNYPHLVETGANIGTLIEMDIIKPLDEYIDYFSDETRSAFEGWFDLAATQQRGFDESRQDALFPLWGSVRSPLVTRRSFFEDTPGLDPDEDWPPESYDEFIETARTLQEDGPVEYGTMVLGSSGDILDNLLPVMAYQYGGVENGDIYTTDWEDTNLDNDAWKQAFSDWVAVYQEHELSPPDTPQGDDEQIGAFLREGTIGIGWHELFTFPQIKAQAPEILDDLMYGVPWGGDNGAVGKATISGLALTKAPEDADEEAWEESQRTAIEYIESTFASREYQMQAFDSYGSIPLRDGIREDIMEQAEENQNYVVPTMYDMIDQLQDTGFTFQNHPENTAVTYTDVPPILQRGLQGEISPEEACDQAAEAARDVITFTGE